MPRHSGTALQSHQCASTSTDDKEVSTPLSACKPQSPRSVPLPADSPSDSSERAPPAPRSVSCAQIPPLPPFACSLSSPRRPPCLPARQLDNATASRSPPSASPTSVSPSHHVPAQQDPHVRSRRQALRLGLHHQKAIRIRHRRNITRPLPRQRPH